jgi:hypothetical protein
MPRVRTIFFLICGLRALLRRDWLAALLAAVLMTFVEGDVRTSSQLLAHTAFYVAMYAIFIFVLLRMGLLPAIIVMFVLNTVGDIPVSGDLYAWYNSIALFHMAVLAAIAIYGFYRSQSSSATRGLAAT